MADERERKSTPTPIVNESDSANREAVSIIITGSSQGIRLMIYTLFKCGFAEVDAWSKVQQMPSSNRLMSVTIKHIHPTETPGDSDSHNA